MTAVVLYVALAAWTAWLITGHAQTTRPRKARR